MVNARSKIDPHLTAHVFFISDISHAAAECLGVAACCCQNETSGMLRAETAKTCRQFGR